MNPDKRIAAFWKDVRALPVRNTPSIRRLRKKLSSDLAALAPPAILAAADRLIASGHRWVAYELVQHHPATMKSLRRKDVEHLGQGMAAWDHVDTFSTCIAGPAWRAGNISDAAVRAWTRSSERWWRRAALVSTVPLNVKAQGGTGDINRTLDICERLAGDHDDMIEKGLSWALRCLVPHDAKAVRGFLRQHDEVLGARVKREVLNKLETGLKNPQRQLNTGRATSPTPMRTEGPLRHAPSARDRATDTSP